MSLILFIWILLNLRVTCTTRGQWYKTKYTVIYKHFWSHYGATTLSIMTLSIKGLYVTLTITDSITDTDHNWHSISNTEYYWQYKMLSVMLTVIVLNVTFYLFLCLVSVYWMSHFIYCYAECLMLSVVMLNAIMLSVVIPKLLL